MTEMKCMHVFSRRGAELDLVRSCCIVNIELRDILRIKFADLDIHIGYIAHNVKVIVDDG